MPKLETAERAGPAAAHQKAITQESAHLNELRYLFGKSSTVQ